MLHIDKEGILPISKQLEAMILEAIRTGELKPGDKVYSENAFAKILDTSRSTVQKVYDRLVLRDVLMRKQGKGTFVSFPTTTENLSLLVGFSEKMRQLDTDSETRLMSIKVVQAVENIALALDIPINSEVISIERLRLVRGVPFVLHHAVVPYPLCKKVLDYDLVHGSLTTFLTQEMSFELDRTQETISAYPASTDEADILCIKQNSPILKVEGRTFDIEGKRIRFSIARYRADIVRLQSHHFR